MEQPSIVATPSLRADDLRITRLRALRGPNYWRLAPVIACDVRLGSLETISSADIPGFADRLLAFLPSLEEHECSLGRAGGFVERLREGTYVPHIMEHVALELQVQSGSDVSFGRVVASGDEGVWWVIVAYEEEQVGLRAVREAVQMIQAAITGESLDVVALIEELHDLYEEVRLGPSTGAIVEEARRRGIPVRRLSSGSLVQLGLGRNLKRIQASMTDYTSAIGVEIAQDKNETKQVLERIGLPVPRGNVVRTLEAAIEAAAEIGYPVLLKPDDASHGRGISRRLKDADGVRESWAAAKEVSPRVIVERFAAGHDHRVLVVNGRVVAVAERIPARVAGDGAHTIRELIDLENRDQRRGIGHRKTLTRLTVDASVEAFLSETGWKMDSVPPVGETVYLRATANLSTGGTSVDRTDEIHPDNATACEMAAGVVGLDVAGIDVMTENISVPFRENGAVILEVNASPGLRMHVAPAEGQSRNVAAAIIDMLFPPGSEPTIPVVAVTGTNGKTTTARLIAHLFRSTEKTVGFTTTDGIYIGNRLVIEGDMTGPFSANVVLSNPSVDVAVLETARGGILRAGLGYDECDVGVVLNITADHLGLRGIHTLEQLAEVKAVIPAVVRRNGHAVLNADDPLVLAMRDVTPADVVLFSSAAEGENQAVEDHLARNGICARLEQGTFVVRRGKLRIPIAAEREVPLMIGGAARFQRGNVLAAIAAAYVQGMRYDDIRAGLLSFFPSPSMTPGRLNLLRIGSNRVVVDYAHNAAAIAGLIEMALELPANRRMGVITVPGDRRDEDIREAGRLAARLDHVIVKEDLERRGREPGEIARIIMEGLRDGGLPEDRAEYIPDETEATRRGVELMQNGDLTIVLADDVPAVLDMLRPLSVSVGPPL